jgi:ABC-type transport system involved in multi-copper enzyme maturation permease subunit
LPSPRPALLWLLAKEWRELLASRAWWIFLILMGPLVGVSFISAARTYAEASGLHGTALGVGEAFSPLVGIWAPTFSSCELAAAFLLPFVAIRLVAGDKQSGALKLEAQHPSSAFARVMAKALVLLAAWLIASLAAVAAAVLWKSYGGSIYRPELSAVVSGHLLNAGLTIALAAAAAAIADHPATAAIITLSITIGSWIINFVAAVHGGFWERLGEYTPTAMVHEFQHGLVRLDLVVTAITLIFTGLLASAIWMRLGVPVRRRAVESVSLAVVAGAVVFFCSAANASWDLSENRMNSFSRADEQALRQIRAPLRIEVHLAPQDPRRADLDRRGLAKLRRLLPRVQVQYISATSIGLFEQTNEHYGEIWYELDGRRTVSRATTDEGVLEAIYSLAEIKPTESDDVFRGHPLAVPPKGAALFFYGIWPALTLTAAFFILRRQS